MQNELNKLVNGKLSDQKELRLINLGLSEIPKEVFQLSELEFLDLSGNKISEIPTEINQLKKLKIIFFSSNIFTVFPKSLAKCPSLTMIGCKSNMIEIVPENSFPTQLQWLILTDNQIKKIPSSIGKLQKLQKLMLAGNQILEFPTEMQNCQNLQLLRISANKIQQLPYWIWNLPSLAWFAYAGNPCSENNTQELQIKTTSWNNIETNELLGEGASGQIFKCKNIVTNTNFAIKIYKGNITSDGLPINEIEAHFVAGEHLNIVNLISLISNHPLQKTGILMELLAEDYSNIGQPPNFETCTRDIINRKFTFKEIKKIAFQTLKVCIHLHKKQILHGDLYAHNILINKNSEIKVGDFGASTIYNSYFEEHQKIEIRAFAYFIEDLIQNCEIKSEKDNEGLSFLKLLIITLLKMNSQSNITFEDILKKDFFG